MRCCFPGTRQPLDMLAGIICPGHSGTMSRPVLAKSLRFAALAQIAFGSVSAKEAPYLHALVGDMRKDAGNKFLQGYNDSVIDRGGGARGDSKDLMVALAVVDLLKPANGIASNRRPGDDRVTT